MFLEVRDNHASNAKLFESTLKFWHESRSKNDGVGITYEHVLRRDLAKPVVQSSTMADVPTEADDFAVGLSQYGVIASIAVLHDENASVLPICLSVCLDQAKHVIRSVEVNGQQGEAFRLDAASKKPIA